MSANRRPLWTRACLVALGLVGCGRGDGASVPSARASSAPSPGASESAAAPADSSTPIPGPTGGAVEVYPPSELAAIAAGLARAGSTGRTVGSHAGYHYVQSRRVASGSPEVHDDWVDVTLVEAGRATLLVGGTVRGGALASPGEHRGGAIVGGTPRPIIAGTLLVVPAGVPHQYQLARGDSIVYLTIKVAARLR